MATRCCSWGRRSGGGEWGPVQGGLMNKLEQVSSDGWQMSLAGEQGWGAGSFQVSCLGSARRTVQWGPMHHGKWSNGDLPLYTDKHTPRLWINYLAATSLAVGNNGNNCLHQCHSLRCRRLFIERKQTWNVYEECRAAPPPTISSQWSIVSQSKSPTRGDSDPDRKHS